MVGTSAALRSGSGTCASVSLMVQSSWPLGCGLLTGRDVAPDKFVDRGFDRRALQHNAAIGPFDFAIAGFDFWRCQNHQATLEAALLRQPLDLFARRLVKRVVDPDHQMRRRNQLREAIAD